MIAPVVIPLKTDSGNYRAAVVRIAAWADDKKTALAPHKPMVCDIIVDLDPQHP